LECDRFRWHLKHAYDAIIKRGRKGKKRREKRKGEKRKERREEREGEKRKREKRKRREGSIHT